MFRVHMKAVDIVQPAVPGLAHHRQRPPVLGVDIETIERPADHRIAHHADAVGIGDHHRAVHQPGFLDPGGAAHLAVAVLAEPAGKHRIRRIVAPTWQDGGHAAAHHGSAVGCIGCAGNQGVVANLDAAHIGDGVERSGRALERNPEVAGTRLNIRRQRRAQQRGAGNQQGQPVLVHVGLPDVRRGVSSIRRAAADCPAQREAKPDTDIAQRGAGYRREHRDAHRDRLSPGSGRARLFCLSASVPRCAR